MTASFDEYDIMQFRQLGRQLLEESPTVLTQLSGPLTKLKANIDAVKRRSGFSAIKENYDGEESGLGLGQQQDKPGSETSDSRGSISSGSQELILDENEEAKMIEFM